MNPIQGIQPLPPSVTALSGGPNASGGGKSFNDFLLDSIHQVNAMQQDADRAVENLFSGGEANPAEVLTAVQKADVAFRMMLQVRNKMVAAFEEVQNLRI
ncbi:MAG: flagellar hook-basal body complex protein FliE [Thermoguttaceae bacterium]|jgi:flagellar hook-basal body complex protein FliE|nr:flagellar hook-basal body complex protein FliE [Thermoguttaceae bacterium]